MRKFKPGGRCGGDSGGCEARETNPEFAGAYSAMLAARSQQDTMWTQPPETAKPQPKPQLQPPPLTQSQQLVVAKPKPVTKKADIDFILDEF